MEEFNLGLKINFRSEKSREKLEKGENKFVKAAMDSKFEDELAKNSEFTRERNKKRRELAARLGKNTRTYNRIIKNLRAEARIEKEEYKKKYKNKLEHLQKKYREDNETKLDRAPNDIIEFSDLSIFDRDKFSRIVPVVYDTATVGDISLDEDEQAILRLNPKFSVVQPLLPGGLEFEQEQAYAKVRMEINKELAEQLEEPIEITEKEQQIIDEMEAKTRQTFDPVTKSYNDQNRRVTDLQECARITLPKPLPTKHEAYIEIRRSMHTDVYDGYRQEYCNKNGEQKSNLTEQESRGLKKIIKRRKEEGLVILKTDKSGKFATTNLENYLKMGQEHTGKDKMITRGDIRDIETTLNCHCRAWCKMWRSGQRHGHLARIMTSKTTTSNNVASMWLALKDHKEGGKSRGIVTGCTSNSKGMSNAVSDVLEAVASSME